jgi:drug/metabolite transporter (DMT)-like permease
MSRRHLLLLIVGVTAVSFSAVLVRLADAPAFAVAFYRCAFASVILVPLGLIRHRVEYRRLTPAQWRLALLSGAVLAAHFATWISSLSFTTVAAAAVLVQTQPVFVAMLGRFVGERPTRRGLVGMGIALGGAVVISSSGLAGGDRAVLGDLLALAGAFFAAVYVVLGRSLRQEISLVTYTSIVYSTAGVALALVMLVSGTAFFGYPAKAWLLFALITAGPQFLGHTVFNYLLGHLRASIVAISLLAEPVGATALAFLILNEAPPASTLIGGAIVLVGVYLAIAAEASRIPEVLSQPVE